jgi:penicillin-binding protein 1C
MKRVLWRSCTGLALAGVLAVMALAFVVRPDTSAPGFDEVKARWRSSEGYLLDRKGVLLETIRLDFGIRRFEWVALDQVSPALVEAVIEGEDRRFREHAGVDWLGVAAAVKDRWRKGQARGASTITMQVAGLIDARARGKGERGSWQRKVRQIRLAREIEERWTKDEILEAYFNLLDFRGELQGIDAASRLLAGKAPSGLDLPESLVMAALLPAPGAGVERVAARACARARERNIGCDRLSALARNLLSRPVRGPQRPGLAPHLARALVSSAGERVATTLDARVQRSAVEMLRRHLADLASHNVRDGALLAVDNASGEVIAYVGSGGPGSRAREVDGVRARRQAGSTLKPFLYELAIERKLLTPASLLDDSPVHLDTANGVYLPQDYDRDFKGLVSVRTALGNSLNIPAVRALVLVGVEPFRQRLENLGYAGIVRDGEYYGYSLALGSAEVSLWEQAQAYRTLARGGRSAALRVRASETAEERAALPHDAAFIVADMLSDRAARSLTFGLDNHLNTPYWSAAKTGTSKDMRDNWCIGFSTRYTVAVWVGNFEGNSMRDVSGVSGAAPVWQELMALLHADQSPGAPDTPAGVARISTTFSPAVEPARNEWFLTGTPTPRVAAVSARDEIARIVSPANGMVIAIDPDIPAKLQRLPFIARGTTGPAHFRLDGERLGAVKHGVLWAPEAGAHRLALEDASGNVIDQVLFTVR